MKVREAVDLRVNAANDFVDLAITEFDDAKVLRAELRLAVKNRLRLLAEEMFDFGFNVGVNVEPVDPSQGQLIGDIELELEQDEPDDPR